MAIPIEYQDDLTRAGELENGMRRYILVQPKDKRSALKFYMAPHPYMKHAELMELVEVNEDCVIALGYVHRYKPGLFGLDTHGAMEPPIQSKLHSQQVLEHVQKLPVKNRSLQFITA